MTKSRFSKRLNCQIGQYERWRGPKVQVSLAEFKPRNPVIRDNWNNMSTQPHRNKKKDWRPDGET